MNQTIPFPIAVLLVAIPLAGIFIWAHIEVKKDEEKFKLENSRQFIMKFSTAKEHSLLEAENGYVTMVYGKKRYKYKIIRIVDKKYNHIHNYSANYYTVHYFVFEKISDEQPPHYYEMKMMKEKEDQIRSSRVSKS